MMLTVCKSRAASARGIELAPSRERYCRRRDLGWLDDLKRRGHVSAPPEPAASRRRRPPGLPRYIWWWFLGALLINFVVTRFVVPGADAPLQIPYTVFKEQVAAQNVAEIYAQGATVEGTFVQAVTYPPEGENRPEGAERPGGAERSE